MSFAKNDRDRLAPVSKQEKVPPGLSGSPPPRGESYNSRSGAGSSSSYSTNKYSSSRSGSRGHSSNSNYNDFNRNKPSSSYSSSSSYDGRRGRDRDRDSGRDSKYYNKDNNRSGHNNYNDYKYKNNRSSRYNNSSSSTSSYSSNRQASSSYDRPPSSATSQSQGGYDKKANTSKYDRTDRYNSNRNRSNVTRTSSDSQQLPFGVGSSSAPHDYKDSKAYTSAPSTPASQFAAPTPHFLTPQPPYHPPLPSSMGVPGYATPSTSQYSSPYPPSTPSSFPQSSPAYSISSEHSQYFTPQYYDPSQSPAGLHLPPGHHLNTLYHPGYGAHPAMSLPGMPYGYQPKPPEPKEAPPKPVKPKVDKNEELIASIVNDIKANGVFDQLRKMCLKEIETKDPYQKVVKHLTATVENIIKDVKWTPDLNANKIRDNIRITTTGAKYFQTGLDSVVDQIVHKEADPEFRPLILDSVTTFLGAKEKKEKAEKEKAENERLEKERLENEKKEQHEKLNKKLEMERLKREQELNEKLQAEKVAEEKQKLAQSSLPSKLKSVEDDNSLKPRNKNSMVGNEGNGQHVFAKPKTPPPEELMEYEDDSESEDEEEDESPNFEALDMASPLRVTREEIEEKFSLEMQEELKRLAAMQ